MTKTALQPEPSNTAPPAEPADVALRRRLAELHAECGLLRPLKPALYEAGQILKYDVTGVMPANAGRIVARVEKFVGGGFAGQVYRVKLLELHAADGPIAGLEVGGTYAIKILKPPSGFACLFRDFLYFVGYQSAFSAQVNPDGVRVGVLWQKLIRRAAAARFGRDNAICDTYATLYDDNLHSFGEINEWVTGRIWKFEVDDRLFDRWKFDGTPGEDAKSGEFVHKKLFQDELVRLLHEMGAPELARQYEWWTCKSQPNALKRVDADASPSDGLTAIDFRAGLTLLPFLPMSPADFWLILRGLAKGRIVQFDRSDPKRFGQFIEAHREEFEDLQPAIEELRRVEPAQRRAMPDVTYNYVRLLFDSSLRTSVREGAITSWEHLGYVDREHAQRLQRRPMSFWPLFLLWFVPLLGTSWIKLWGDPVRRAHLGRLFTSPSYLWRAMRGARIPVLIAWHRAGRVSDERALRLVFQPVRYWTQRILVGWMPPTWHRSFTEPSYGWQLVKDRIGFVLNMLRHPEFREQWLLDQVELGRGEGMLTDEEAAKISSQVKDPFIQKYLRCLAVHLCTVPVTQICMLIVGGVVLGYFLARGYEWPAAMALGTGAAAAIQLMPISPGSTARGLFVLYMMLRDRDVKNYCIAAPISFLHVIGYLAFPLQMVAHDPALARFLAGRWAKSAVGFVPVFGENGGLLEHAVFDTFFNFPLAMKRRFKERPIGTTILSGLILTCVAWIVYKLAAGAVLLYALGLRWWIA